jgi:hypothetical protein
MLHPATSLDDVYRTLSPEPLLTPEQVRAFYSDRLNTVRGDDKGARLALALNRAFGGSYYKAFLMGHPGVGKSTELTRLIQRVSDKYRAIRFSATSALDPASFKPFDVLLLMMAEIAEKTAEPKRQGGAGQKPSEARLKEIWEWFATEKKTLTETTHLGTEATAGAGISGDSWWAKTLGLFASLKGEIKYAADRKKEIVEYRLSRLSTLIELANRLLDECNQLLRKAVSKEWLFIGEDFDKPGIPIAQVEGLFLTYANIFKELRTHLIFTIPIAFGYSQQAVQLPFAGDRLFSIPDTPVFRSDHTAHAEGREALRSVLEARVAPELFADGQMMRLIVASGGNLRDLFSLVTQAADNALLRQPPGKKIDRSDADSAIDNLRTEYTRRLGDSPYDKDQIPYESKAERLVAIYNSDPNAAIPDTVLYSLLRSRAVQEFNGKGWFGVHPLVADILKSQDRIPRTAAGGTE